MIKRIGELTGPDAYYAAGVGQHQMWASHFLPWELPGRWLNSGGLGTMGYCVPAAMGAKVGRPDAIVWGIDGDGCFQMTNQGAGHLRPGGHPDQDRGDQQPEPGHGPAVADPVLRQPLLQHRPEDQPDPGLPEARRGDGLRRAASRSSRRTWTSVIEKALSINDAPVVVEFVVHKDAMVWPMVAAGTSNDDIKVARDMAPRGTGDWDSRRRSLMRR